MVKPGTISIRRLMPHRRTGSDGSENFEESSADEQHDLQFRRPSQTWMPNTSKTKLNSTSPMSIRKSNTMPRSVSPLPFGASTTSLLDNGSPSANDPFRSSNRKAAAVLGVPPTPRHMTVPPKRPARPSNGHLGLDESVAPHSPRPSISNRRPESPLTPNSRRAGSPRTPNSYRPESPLPPLSLNDSSPMQLGPVPAKHKREERELPSPPQQAGEDWSENVKQLIEETDMAFKAVGTALAEAKLASYTFDRDQTPTPPPLTLNTSSKPSKELPPLPRSSAEFTEPILLPSMLEAPIVVEVPPTPADAEIPIVLDVPLYAPPPPPPSAPEVVPEAAPEVVPSRKTPSPEPTPPAVSAPPSPAAPSPKAQAAMKKVKAKRNKGWPTLSQAMAQRLGLSDNVTDILTGQRFKRIEADEMLTAQQIKDLKRIREDARKQANKLMKTTRPSTESERSASAEPKQELSGDCIQELPSQNESAESEDYEDDDYEEECDAKKSEPQTFSSKFPPRVASRLEVAEAEEQASQASEEDADMSSQRQKLIESLTSEEDDEYIYLKSTPYTLTNPCFKHGKITLSKTEVNKVMMTVDDTLDWTAFQMAILGGAGDLMSGYYEEEDEDMELGMADEVSSWFDTFGFESFGQLVPGDGSEPRSRDSAQSVSSESSNSSIDPDADLPIPLGSESPTSFWHGAASPNTTKFLRSSGLKRWSAAVPDGTHRKILTSHTRDSSLPTSPMTPLVVGGVGGEGDIDESVADGMAPMGYNLGHDLGDFLRWEAEQMFGSGYYGASRA